MYLACSPCPPDLLSMHVCPPLLRLLVLDASMEYTKRILRSATSQMRDSFCQVLMSSRQGLSCKGIQLARLPWPRYLSTA